VVTLIPLVARTILNLPQCASELINLPFIGELLAFGQFHQFQDFLHFVLCLFQRPYDLHHIIKRLWIAATGAG
jgi:hypothetical protein